MTTRELLEKSDDDILDEIRQRMRDARPDQIKSLLRDIEDRRLPDPTHYSNTVH